MWICQLLSHAMAVSRETYKTDVDFTALALQYPDFAKKWVQRLVSLCLTLAGR